MSRRTALLLAALAGFAALAIFDREEPLVPREAKWTLTGSFGPDAVYPVSDGTALVDSPSLGPSPLLYGSFAGDAEQTGALASPVFRAPAIFAVYVTGYPEAAGVSLELQRERDGKRHPLRVTSPGRRWVDARFVLPPGFWEEPVRLAATDDTASREGWLGVTTPRAINAASLVRGWVSATSPVPSAVLVGVLVLALLASRIAEVPGLAGRSARVGGVVRGALPRLALVGLAAVFLAHWLVLHRYAVDIPYREEWHHLTSGLAPALSWEWLWSSEAGHREVWTRAHTWFLYHSGGWSLRTQILQNFLLYGGMLAAVVWFARRHARHLETWALLAFLLFLLSALAAENHQWGIQSRVHFALLFTWLFAGLSFPAAARPPALWAAAAAGIAAAVSADLGRAACVTIAGALAASAGWRAIRAARGAATTDASGLRAPAAWGPVALALGIAAFVIVTSPGGDAAAAAPYTSIPPSTRSDSWVFWRHFLDLVSSGFCVATPSTLLGAFWLAVVVAPLTADVVRHRGRLPTGRGAVLAVALAILAMLAVSSHQYAALGAGSSKASRLAEPASMLIPLAAMAWSGLLVERPRARAHVLTALWLGIAFASVDDWTTTPYRQQRFLRADGVGCVERTDAGLEAGMCPTLALRPIAAEIDRARELNVHFTRRLAPPSDDAGSRPDTDAQ